MSHREYGRERIMREWERVHVCDKERERERERVCVCVCMIETVRKRVSE